MKYAEILKKYDIKTILTVAILAGAVFFVVFKLPLDIPEDFKILGRLKEEDWLKPLANPPKTIKAVYFTASSARDEKKINYLLDLARTTEVNAVVADIKDSSGRVIMKDIDSFIRRLHKEGIYVIARIVVFQDPVLARARPDLAIKNKWKGVWRDRKGLAWIDPAASDAWYYNIAIAQDAAKRGFDELNFDYIRFPSDGDLDAIVYSKWDRKTPKNQVIKAFFRRLRESLPNTRLSADLFGFVTSHTDDLGVGQIIEDAFEYFDYISPMVYPSHYPPGFLGFENPAAHPYEVVRRQMDSASKRLEEFKNLNISNRSISIRPWLQDFDLGANYTPAMVRSEIKATMDALGDQFQGFMLWNPANIYSPEALSK